MNMVDFTGEVLVSILLGLIVLIGEEDRDWEYIETDPAWWTVRLWTRRN
ncbi:MAG: hypothetical protein KAT75_04305 [Dehalococcoidia bacterium]|nr:hypothetical protein [Dehalococcoidia bacterium]